MGHTPLPEGPEPAPTFTRLSGCPTADRSTILRFFCFGTEALFSEACFEPGREPPIVTEGVFDRDRLSIAGPSTGWSDTPSAFSFPALSGFCLEGPGTAGPAGEESRATESSWSGTETATEAAAPAELVSAEFSTGGSAGEVNLFQTNH